MAYNPAQPCTQKFNIATRSMEESIVFAVCGISASEQIISGSDPLLRLKSLTKTPMPSPGCITLALQSLGNNKASTCPSRGVSHACDLKTGGRLETVAEGAAAREGILTRQRRPTASSVPR